MNSSFVTEFRYGAVAMIFFVCVYRVLCGNDSSVRQGETAVGVKFVKIVHDSPFKALSFHFSHQ